jgi:glucan endo-1,3-alpha-glucosidase
MHPLPLLALFLALSALPHISSITLPLPHIHHFSSTAPPSKLVVAHFIVGNTYPYTIDDWTQGVSLSLTFISRKWLTKKKKFFQPQLHIDITLASSKGIDAFALNVGRDSWQPDRVADAFTAANAFSATKFKLFLSFDMTSLPCSASTDANTLTSYIGNYHAHPNYLLYLKKPLVSTFAGENCRFGASDLNTAWYNAIKSAGQPQIYFVPAFFVDPSTFPSLDVMDGSFNVSISAY